MSRYFCHRRVKGIDHLAALVEDVAYGYWSDVAVSVPPSLLSCCDGSSSVSFGTFAIETVVSRRRFCHADARCIVSWDISSLFSFLMFVASR